MIEPTVIVVDKEGKIIATGGAEWIGDGQPDPLAMLVAAAETFENPSHQVSYRIPDHLMPVLKSIARRQRTTVQVIIAQALADYCNGAL